MAVSSTNSTREHEIMQLRERYQMGQSLLDRAHVFKTCHKTQGMQRIEKQIKAEMTMLNKLLSGAQIIKDHHLHSTNLLHLEGVLHICENNRDHHEGVVAVERFFKFTDTQQQQGLVQTVMVDVVCNGGTDWVKVFARKRHALHRKWLGECNFGDKSVTDFAEDFIKASSQNPHNFNSPSIIFVFFDGITESVATSLKELDIKVVGPVYPDDSIEEVPSPLQVAAMFGSSMSHQPMSLPVMEQTSIKDKCTLINLDISSMLAWISSITNSTSSKDYNDRVLAEQARQEMENPLWPILQKATQGKSLIACQTAIEDFKSIVEVVGGPNEKERAKVLLANTRIVEDQPSERAMKLHCSGKIKERAKIIFGTGDTLKAITLTANEGFVRAATGRGVQFNVIVHPCRALAELDYKYTVMCSDDRQEEEREDDLKKCKIKREESIISLLPNESQCTKNYTSDNQTTTNKEIQDSSEEDDSINRPLMTIEQCDDPPNNKEN